ncbi:MAG: DUF433 domain-containing protein [Spirulina sp. SIO3F2]|nr:DUF433 domain-containing protein [Spirulina sp. SIO3F2]
MLVLDGGSKPPIQNPPDICHTDTLNFELCTLNFRPAVLVLNYPHIEKPAEQPARLQRLPRIRVAQIVMDYLAYGWSVEEICRQHPYIKPAEAYAAMGYYFDHQAEIDQEIAQEWKQTEVDAARAVRSPFYIRMKARGLL